MTISREFVEELKSRVDIVSVASRYLSLKKVGRNYFGLCPFHTEKTPSFSINPDLQIFKCFGCGKSGDVITLIMELERINYVEAIKFLADSAGMTLPDDFKKRESKEIEDYYLYLEKALSFFTEKLFREGAETLRYLQKRGIKPETIRKFSIGFAPPDGFSLVNYFKKLGFDLKKAATIGLVGIGRGGTFFDKFVNRIMIPIFNTRNKIVGFGGRSLIDKGPKYLNSPESAIFKKGEILFGLNLSKDWIKKKDSVILVEGYFDVILPFQEGIKNVVAPLGTSLTKEQVRLLRRYTQNVFINFDMDAAGMEATKRTVMLFMKGDFNIKVIDLDGGKDPDEYIRKYGVKEYFERIEKSSDVIDFLFRSFNLKYRELPENRRKSKIFEDFLPFLFKIDSEVELSSFLSYLSSKLGVREDFLFSEFEKRKKNEKKLNFPNEKRWFPELPKFEKDIIYFIFSYPEKSVSVLKDFLRKNETFFDFFQSNIMAVILKEVRTGNLNLEDVKKKLSEEELELINNILSGVSLNFSEGDFLFCIEKLRKNKLEGVLRELSEKIKSAEEEGDEKEIGKLMNIYLSIIKLIGKK